MKRYKKYLLTLSILLLSLLFIILIDINTTNSRYISTSRTNNPIKIAPWKINVNGEINSILELDLKNTIIPNSFTNSDIIPGSEGVIPIRIDTTETKVAVDYEIVLDESETIVPENLKFYQDSTYKKEFTIASGTIPTNQNEIYVINIYWRWNYTQEDETDTWSNKTIKTKINITAKQAINGD